MPSNTLKNNIRMRGQIYNAALNKVRLVTLFEVEILLQLGVLLQNSYKVKY